MPALPSLKSSMKSRACFSITLIASKMLLLKTPWGWGPTSRPIMKEKIRKHICTWKTVLSQLNGCLGDILNKAPPPSRAIWPDLSDSPTGCLATEREVEYFKRGCSLSRTRQLAGAMAFCNTKVTKARAQLWIKKNTQTFTQSHAAHRPTVSDGPHRVRVLWGFPRLNRKFNLH